MAVWLAWLLGALPLLGWLLLWWNELFYAIPLLYKYSGTAIKLPPGHMGLPFFGEMFTFLWYFKILRHPDEFINAKRRKYGDGVGMYRTHLFGSPTIIVSVPSAIKFILKSPELFPQQWPKPEMMGPKSLVAVNGPAHDRLRRYVIGTINTPDALRRIALAVQPRVVAALQSWAQKGKIKTYNEVKKVTCENIGKLFVSLDKGPILDTMESLYEGLMQGFRAMPLKFPGTAFYHALQCRKKIEAILREELEKKKRNMQDGIHKTNDLMDGLMQMKDEKGDQLSDQEVLDNIVSLIIGGYESTTLASMWAVHYLAKFPEVLKKLREENMDHRKSKQGDYLTHEDVSKLKYTNKVVEETIRMANISAFVFRLVSQEVEFQGYKIPKNWKVILWLRYLHTNPENFEDPLCFNPDRWNEPMKPGVFMAFGGGVRICAGNMLARMQLVLFLHHLSVGYKWELLNPDAKILCLPNPRPVDGVEVSISAI